MQLHIVEASAEGDFETAFASLAPLHVGALIVGADPLFNARRSQIVALAARHSMPAIYEYEAAELTLDHPGKGDPRGSSTIADPQPPSSQSAITPQKASGF